MINDLNSMEMIRKAMELVLTIVPEEKKIELPRETLEKLLFDVVEINSGEKGKIPVWSGKFLRKLDLSKISFEDVCWTNAYLLDEIQEKYKNTYNKMIDYSCTNANIDFTKSHEGKINSNNIMVKNCNFADVDLSNVDYSNASICIRFLNTDVSNTGIKLGRSSLVVSTNSNFSNVDLSKITLTPEDFSNDFNYDLFFSNSFENTGLTIEEKIPTSKSR